MKHGRFSAALAAAALLGALGTDADRAGAREDARARAHPQLERVLVGEINRVRAAHRRPALRAQATLARAARGHSRYLSGTAQLAHESSGGAPFGRAWWPRATRAPGPWART